MSSKIFDKTSVKFKNRQIIVESEENDFIAHANLGHNSDESSNSIDQVIKQQLITTQSTFDIFIIENISLTESRAELEFIILQHEQICEMIRNILHMKLQFMIINMFDFVIQAFKKIRTFDSSKFSIFSFDDFSFDFFDHVESKSKLYYFSIKSLSVDQMSYFDSEYKKKRNKTTLFSSSIESMMITDKYVYYKNVYVFVDRLKNLVSQHEHNQIRNVLKSCFRDDAQIWHIYELSDIIKDFFREISLFQWYDVMIIRFKFKAAAVIQKLTSQIYNLNKMKVDTTSKIWIMHMLHQIRIVELIFIFNKLIIIWNRLDLFFRRDILEFIEHITLELFLNQIDSKQFIWMKMIDRRQQFQIQFQQRIVSEYYEYQFNIQQRFQNQRRDYIDNNKSSFRISISDIKQIHFIQVENEYEYYDEEKNILYR